MTAFGIFKYNTPTPNTLNAMRKFQILAFFILAIAGTVAGQTCPGPAVRTALLNLQRANTTLTTNTVTGPRAGQFGLTDSCGNQRYQYYVRVLDSVDCICCNPFTTPAIGAPASAFVKICGTDSLFYFDWKREPLFLGESLTITQILDSLQNDTAFQRNWYTVDDTTTSPLRTAYISGSAQWLGLDTEGYLLFQVGDLSVGDVFINDQGVTLEYTSTPIGTNTIIARQAGLELTTSETVSRAIFINTDTLNTQGSFDPTNFRLNFNSDNSYLYADSLKVVGLGQFPAFPSLAFDGTDKGFFYDSGSGLTMINGDGQTGATGYFVASPTQLDLYARRDAASSTSSNMSLQANPDEGGINLNANSSFATHSALSMNFSTAPDINLMAFRIGNLDTNRVAAIYIGENFTGSNYAYAGARAAGFRTQIDINQSPFDWIQTYLPNDTTTQTVSFYNRAYYFPNDRPSNTLNDTSIIAWIGDGTNAGKHPQFVPLPGAGSTVNWYNSNSTTTENTRIADVLETATWRSDNVTLDGIVPFRFELAGSPANEPEMMTWQFDNGDSLLLYRSDQEIVFNSNTSTVFRSDVNTQLNAPTTSMSNNVGGFLTLNDAGTLSHSAATMHYNLSNGSSGTSQVELLITGPFTPITLTAGQTLNFRVSVRARCTNVGNGVGITSGDSYASWNVGCIKLVGTTTSIVGTVQQVVADQADTGMSTAVTTIDADDTDESLRIRFTPPSTAGTTTVIAITATVEITQ